MIHHHIEQCYFEILDDGGRCVLEYQLLRSPSGDIQAVDFIRTFVPEGIRGKGYAETLVRHGLAWANQHQYRIETQCWYVEKFVKRTFQNR